MWGEEAGEAGRARCAGSVGQVKMLTQGHGRRKPRSDMTTPAPGTGRPVNEEPSAYVPAEGDV